MYNSNPASDYAESSRTKKRLIQGLVDLFGMAVGFISFIIVRYTLVSLFFVNFKYLMKDIQFHHKTLN